MHVSYVVLLILTQLTCMTSLQAYVFDIRCGTYQHKLTGHTDTVSDVAFHPLHPVVSILLHSHALALVCNGRQMN